MLFLCLARRCLSANLQDAQGGTLENEISQSHRLKIEHGIMGIFLDFNQGHSVTFIIFSCGYGGYGSKT